MNGFIQEFDCGAQPADSAHGTNWFVIDETGVLRQDDDRDGIADASDTAIIL